MPWSRRENVSFSTGRKITTFLAMFLVSGANCRLTRTWPLTAEFETGGDLHEQKYL